MSESINIQEVIRQTLDQYIQQDAARREPAHQTELQEERRRRETLERRVNELVEENKRARSAADEAERATTIRSELQRLGVSKLELAYRAVQSGIVRTEDGRLVGRGDNGEQPVSDYLAGFVQENPEFLPARIPGGTGMTVAHKSTHSGRGGPVDLDLISPAMSKEERDRVRQEILRVASQTLRGA